MPRHSRFSLLLASSRRLEHHQRIRDENALRAALSSQLPHGAACDGHRPQAKPGLTWLNYVELRPAGGVASPHQLSCFACKKHIKTVRSAIARCAPPQDATPTTGPEAVEGEDGAHEHLGPTEKSYGGKTKAWICDCCIQPFPVTDI